jgi:hypothetical protein
MDDDADWGQALDTLLGAGDLGGAERFARSIKEPWQSAEALCRVAKLLAESGDRDRAAEVWGHAIRVARFGEESAHAQDSIDSSSVLWEIAADMAHAGQIEDAEGVARAIRNDGKRRRALDAVTKLRAGQPPS